MVSIFRFFRDRALRVVEVVVAAGVARADSSNFLGAWRDAGGVGTDLVVELAGAGLTASAGTSGLSDEALTEDDAGALVAGALVTELAGEAGGVDGAGLAVEPVPGSPGGEPAVDLTEELVVVGGTIDVPVAKGFSSGVGVAGLAGAPGTLVGNAGAFASGLAVEIVVTGRDVGAVAAEVFSEGVTMGGFAGAPGTLVGSRGGAASGLAVEMVVTGREVGVRDGFAGAPGTLVGCEGALSTGLASSTLIVGLSMEAGAVGLGFDFEGGKRKSGTFLRLAIGSGSIFFGTVGAGVAADLIGSITAGFSFEMGGGAWVVLTGVRGTAGASAFLASTGRCGACNFSVGEPGDLSISGGTCADEGAGAFSAGLTG